MLKKALISASIISALLVTPASFATEGFFYLGAKGGLETLRAKQTDSVQFDSAGVSDTVAGGYFGYQVKFSNYFSAALEAEILSREHELDYTANGIDYQASLDSNQSVGVILKHHYADNVDFNLRFSTVSSEIAINPDSDPTDISTADLNGYQMGVGFDLMNDSQMTFRLEYVYSNFGEKDLYPSTTNKANETAIRSSAIMLGAHYRF